MKELFDMMRGKAGAKSGEQSKERVKEQVKERGRAKLNGIAPFIIIAVLGVLLMQLAKMAGEPVSESVNPPAQKEADGSFAYENSAGEDGADYISSLEKRLEETLSRARGVGRVKAFLTLSENGETYLAQDTTYEASRTISGSESVLVSEKNETRHVFSAGGDTPVAIKIGAPKIEGAVIVAEGAEDARVKTAIIKACAAALNLSPHKIEVLTGN